MVENLVLRDIVVENGNRTPFDLHGVDGALLENLVARNSAYGNGIQITGCIDITIVGCTTEGNAWGGVAFYVSDRWDLACSNIIFDFAANSIGEYVYSQDESGSPVMSRFWMRPIVSTIRTLRSSPIRMQPMQQRSRTVSISLRQYALYHLERDRSSSASWLMA